MGSLFASIRLRATSIALLLILWERNPRCRLVMWERKPITSRNIWLAGRERRSLAAHRRAAAGIKSLLQFRTAKLKFIGIERNCLAALFLLTGCNRDSSGSMQ